MSLSRTADTRIGGAEIGRSTCQPVNWTTVATLSGAWLAAQVALLRATRRT